MVLLVYAYLYLGRHLQVYGARAADPHPAHVQHRLADWPPPGARPQPSPPALCLQVRWGGYFPSSCYHFSRSELGKEFLPHKEKMKLT